MGGKALGSSVLVVLFCVLLAGCSCGRDGIHGQPDASGDDLVDDTNHETDASTEPDTLEVDSTGCDVDTDLSEETSHWSIRIGGPDDDLPVHFATRHDGALVLMGYHSTSPYLWKITIDGSGEVLSQSLIEGIDGYLGARIVPLRDCGLLLVGTTTEFGAGQRDIWIARLDSSGSIMWQKTVGDSGGESFPAIIQTEDGGFFMSALTRSYSIDNDLWLVKLHGDGSIDWQFRIGNTYDETAFARQGVVEGLEGELYAHANIVTSTSDHAYSPLLLRLDATGSIRWQKSFEGPDGFTSNALALVESGLLIGGEDSGSPGGLWMWLAQVDSSGTLLWHRKYGHVGFDSLHSILPRTDGGSIVSGQYDSGTTEIEYQLWLASLEPGGSISWQVSVGDEETDSGGWAGFHRDGLVIMGMGEPSGAPTGPIAVTFTRLGLDGTFSGSCPLITPGVATSADIALTISDTDFVPTITTATVQDAHASFREVDVPSERLCPE